MQNIAATDQLAVDVQLRIGRPVLKLFDLFPDDGVVEHVDRFVFCQS